MSTITVVRRDGSRLECRAETGISLMKIIRNGGADELLALCGGVCSCATCHVYVDPMDRARLPAIEELESDLLESLEHRRETSRLSCQIAFAPELDGLVVEIAPEE